jgi:hypothetical protein
MNFANPPDSDGVNRPAMLLQLRLVHSRGNARDGVLVVPSSGVGMADALELGGERLSDAQWRAANLCRIALQGDGKGWQLVNNSQTLVCALNGERVTARRPLAVAPGDTLELGLLRFVVEAGEGAAPLAAQSGLLAPPIQPSESTGRRSAALLPSGAEADAAFDLRDLAVPAGGGHHVGVLDDPFGVLDIAGAEARPVADPLSELLGEARLPLPATSPVGHVDLMEAAPCASDRTQEGRVSAVTQRLPTLENTGANPAMALFDDLHAEYVRVVRDPTQLAGRTDWEGFLAPSSERAPTLEELSREAEPYPLLRDILLAREGIDQVIDNFDPLGRPRLLDEEGPEDVLRLFAPELARNAKAPMPSLTRREHHALSPDSHMHLGPSRPDDRDTSQ